MCHADAPLLLRRAKVETALKVNRPHLQLTSVKLADDQVYRTVSRFNHVKHRTESDSVDPLPAPRTPGWVLVPPDGKILNQPSYATLSHVLLAEAALYPEGSILSDATLRSHIWRHREAMLSTLTPSDRGYYDSFLCELPPPDRRHNDSEGMKCCFEILRAARWIPPQQGVVLHCPRNHWRLPESYWLVVSNTEFNRRYPFPIFGYVPLIAPEHLDLSIQDCAAIGRLVWQIDGREFIAVEERFRTFDIAQEWFNSCPKCYRPKKAQPHSWLMGSKEDEVCIKCDSVAAQWPQEVDRLPSSDLSIILKRVLCYLKAQHPFAPPQE